MDTLQRISSLPHQGEPFLFEHVKESELDGRVEEIFQAVLINFLTNEKHPIYKLSTEYIPRPEKPSFQLFSSRQCTIILLVCLIAGYCFYKKKITAAITFPFISIFYFYQKNYQTYHQTFLEYKAKKDYTHKLYLTPIKGRVHRFLNSMKPSLTNALGDSSKNFHQWEGEGNFLVSLAAEGKKETIVRDLNLQIRKHHLDAQEPYLYSVNFLFFSKYAKQVYQKSCIEGAVYLSRYKRPKPQLGSALEENGSLFDMISLEKIPEGTWTSPEYLFLQNHVIALKDYLKCLFTTGKQKHPIHQRNLSSQEQKKINSQIPQILQIHKKTLHTALEVTLTNSEKQSIYENKELLWIDDKGQLKQNAVDKISYCYNISNDPKKFIESVQPQLDRIIFQTHATQSYIYFCNAYIYDVVRQNSKTSVSSLFATINNVSDIPVRHKVHFISLEEQPSNHNHTFLLNLNIWSCHVYCKAQLTYYDLTKAQEYYQLMQNQMLKEFSQQLLTPLGFFQELEQETLIKKRIETFERLVGIKLSRE